MLKVPVRVYLYCVFLIAFCIYFFVSLLLFSSPVNGSTMNLHTNETIVPNSFLTDLLDHSIPGVCGWSKCFFRSKVDPKQFGYLLSISVTRNRSVFVWSQAKKLQRKYGADQFHHIYLDPPLAFEITSNIVDNFKRQRIRNMKDFTVTRNLSMEDLMTRSAVEDDRVPEKDYQEDIIKR